ncbi:MAG: hypothetical protein RJA61_659 [Candidatus Parcubacteria bacterium]|jgi:hypothetical protein
MIILRKFFVPILIGLIFLVAGFAYYYYSEAQKFKNNPQAQTQEEVDSLVAEVSRIILLPQDEDPTIATVSDPERLKDQPFFAKAKAGDKVLLYANAKKAYLYDPINKKILEVAPINLGSEVETQQ